LFPLYLLRGWAGVPATKFVPVRRESLMVDVDVLEPRCRVCTSPKRAAIEAAQRAGEPERAVSRRFEVSRASLSRHRDRHLSARSSDAASEPEQYWTVAMRFTGRLGSPFGAGTVEIDLRPGERLEGATLEAAREHGALIRPMTERERDNHLAREKAAAAAPAEPPVMRLVADLYTPLLGQLLAGRAIEGVVSISRVKAAGGVLRQELPRETQERLAKRSAVERQGRRPEPEPPRPKRPASPLLSPNLSPGEIARAVLLDAGLITRQRARAEAAYQAARRDNHQSADAMWPTWQFRAAATDAVGQYNIWVAAEDFFWSLK
jgi:hypothetical protein